LLTLNELLRHEKKYAFCNNTFAHAVILS